MHPPPVFAVPIISPGHSELSLISSYPSRIHQDHRLTQNYRSKAAHLLFIWNVNHRQRNIGEVFANSIRLHCIVRVSPGELRYCNARVFWPIPPAISSPSLQNGNFTEVNRPFRVPRVYIHENSHAITDMLYPISLACVLFISIRYALSSPSCHFFRSHSCRYVSIAVMVVSNYGFFATSFTDQTCKHFYLLAPAFKGLSSLMFIRTILTTQ